MHAMVDDVRTVDDLRRFVHSTICRKENLLADQFAMSESQLVRGSTVCGLQFSVRGPRSVRLDAIWAADQNALYLYDAKGARYAKLQLAHRFAVEPLTATA